MEEFFERYAAGDFTDVDVVYLHPDDYAKLEASIPAAEPAPAWGFLGTLPPGLRLARSWIVPAGHVGILTSRRDPPVNAPDR